MRAFFFSSRRRHARYWRDWSSDVCSSDLGVDLEGREIAVKDARLDELQPLAVEGGTDPEPLMAESRVFGWLADDPMLVRSVARVLEAVDRDGLEATVESYLDAQPGRVAA